MEVPVELKRLVDGIFADTLAFASIQEASEVAGLVEVLQHRLDALAVEIVDNVDRCGCNTQDGAFECAVVVGVHVPHHGYRGVASVVARESIPSAPYDRREVSGWCAWS